MRTVDRETLRDIRDVEVNAGLPKEARILDFIRQIVNPYCYRYGDYVVKISFTTRWRRGCHRSHIVTGWICGQKGSSDRAAGKERGISTWVDQMRCNPPLYQKVKGDQR